MCAVLSKYWPAGYLSVTLNGPLVSPNYKVQKIHFPDSVATGIASWAPCARTKAKSRQSFFRDLVKRSEELMILIPVIM